MRDFSSLLENAAAGKAPCRAKTQLSSLPSGLEAKLECESTTARFLSRADLYARTTNQSRRPMLAGKLSGAHVPVGSA